MMTRDRKTDRSRQRIREMLDGLARDGSLKQVGSRCQVPITDDDRHAAVVKALEVADRQWFQTERHLANWMVKVMHNNSVDRFRKARRQRLLPNTTLTHFVRERPVAEQNQVVWECLQDLPETEQRILDAYYYDNCTDGDLAMLLFGSATPAASQRARRQRLQALVLLAEKLQGCDV